MYYFCGTGHRLIIFSLLGGTSPSRHSDEERLRGCPEPKLLTGTQAVHPCFIEILGMWASSLKILFIYLRERGRQQEREPKQGSGKERSRLPVEKSNEGLLSGTL